MSQDILTELDIEWAKVVSLAYIPRKRGEPVTFGLVELRSFIQDLITEAEEATASKIFNLAHKYAQEDKTMIGSEELRAYHYYNAIHIIGKFEGR